jgi:hypothetical protein
MTTETAQFGHMVLLGVAIVTICPSIPPSVAITNATAQLDWGWSLDQVYQAARAERLVNCYHRAGYASNARREDPFGTQQAICA